MAREDNCLPTRIKSVLALVNQGDFALVGERITDSFLCPEAEACELSTACRRIHGAFMPLVPKHG